MPVAILAQVVLVHFTCTPVIILAQWLLLHVNAKGAVRKVVDCVGEQPRIRSCATIHESKKEKVKKHIDAANASATNAGLIHL